MASEENLDKVRIPSELHAQVSRFLSGLQRQIIHEAARRAWQHRTDDKSCFVEKEDIVASAQAAFAGVTSKLEQALTYQGPRHVRKAS